MCLSAVTVCVVFVFMYASPHFQKIVGVIKVNVCSMLQIKLNVVDQDDV